MTFHTVQLLPNVVGDYVVSFWDHEQVSRTYNSYSEQRQLTLELKAVQLNDDNTSASFAFHSCPDWVRVSISSACDPTTYHACTDYKLKKDDVVNIGVKWCLPPYQNDLTFEIDILSVIDSKSCVPKDVDLVGR